MHNILKFEARTIRFNLGVFIWIVIPQEIGPLRWNRKTGLASKHLSQNSSPCPTVQN